MHSLNQQALGRAIADERTEAFRRRAKAKRSQHPPPAQHLRAFRGAPRGSARRIGGRGATA